MARKVWAVVVCALCARVVTLASNEIHLWEGDNSHCVVDQDRRWVTIIWPGTYKLDAWREDPNYVGLGDINLIQAELDPNAPAGPIFVSVERDPNFTGGVTGQPGAMNVKGIKLHGVPDAHIVNLIVTGDLCELNDFDATDVTGQCVVGSPADPNTGHIRKDIVLDSFTGTIRCNSMQNLTVTTGQTQTVYTAQIFVEGPYTATMTLPDTMGLAWLEVGGATSGALQLGGSVNHVELWGGLRWPGSVDIGGNATFTRVTQGIDAGTSFRVHGLVGPQLYYTFLVYCDDLDGDPNAVQMDGLLDLVGYASDVHIYGLTRGDVHLGGNVGILGFDRDLVGTCEINGNVERYIVFGGGWPDAPAALLGVLQINGNLSTYANHGWGLKLPEGSLIGDLTIQGDLATTVLLAEGTLFGNVFVGGNITDGGGVDVSQDIVGAIDVQGDFESGAIITYGDLWYDPIVNPAGGHVAIDGSFGRSHDASVQVLGEMGAGSFVCVDYDGFDAADEWGPHGYVRVGNDFYYGNDSDHHIYRTTGCRGDANGDGLVDTGDTDGMLKAIQGEAVYAAAYRALAGSWLFHCDLGSLVPAQCDSLVNTTDFHLFLRRWGHCSTLCGILGGLLPTAGDAAVELATAVDPTSYGELLHVTDELAAEHPDEPVREYWGEVNSELQ